MAKLTDYIIDEKAEELAAAFGISKEREDEISKKVMLGLAEYVFDHSKKNGKNVSVATLFQQIDKWVGDLPFPEMMLAFTLTQQHMERIVKANSNSMIEIIKRSL